MTDHLSMLAPISKSRPFWGAVAAAATASGIWLGSGEPHGIWTFVGVWILPDIALLAGISSGLAKGQIHPRAVRLYNTLHSLMAPAAVAVAATAFGWSDLGFVAALAWTSHIGWDRLVGYGMRDKNGYQHGL